MRRRAFELWSFTTVKGDISTLRTIAKRDRLGDAALFQRLRRGDREAIAELVDRLQQNDAAYWWQAGRYIWSDELTAALDKALQRMGDRPQRTWDSEDATGIDWILAERLMELPTGTAEDLLIKHWDHLRFASRYVITALYTATPRLMQAAAQALAEHPDPESVFKHITMRFGVNTKGRSGITRLAQVQALLPYFNQLSDFDLRRLWEICSRPDWLEFRRQHLDSRLKRGKGNILADDSRAATELDDMVNKGHMFWADHWVERFLRTGVSVDHIMEVVQNWLSGQTDIRALMVASQIVSHGGQRRHLGILSIHNIVAAERTKPIIDNACFSLKRRTLV